VITKNYQIWKITYKQQTERGWWGRGVERAAEETDLETELRTLYLHNIYNRPRSGTIQRLRQELQALRQDHHVEHVVVGDMNAHHPAWGGPGTRIDSDAETILKMVDEYNIVINTKEGMVTWVYKD
jgi:endonuclease/exonuclease/phosphatase family metal-dependent hydrolase